MSRRIEIEITSLKGDVATWRAAGAKLPKGVLDANLVPGGAVVGHVYRADVEQYMEGMEVLSVMPPKSASPLDPRNERIELIPVAKSGPDVIVTYAPKGRGPRRDGVRDGARTGGRDARRSGPRADGDSRERPRRDAPRPDGAERPERPERPARTERSERPARAASPRSERPVRGGTRPPRRERPSGPIAPPVTTTHRNALLATLSPEQLPVAEQLLRGGMPAVRTAVAEQNKNATAQGRPTVDPVTIERIAEDLLGRTNLAMWKDRAAGAIGAGKELRLRDLRAVVTSAKTVSLDEESRAQLKELQAALTTRLEALRTQWNERLEAAVSSNNVEEALRLVARPPDMSTRVGAEMAVRVVGIVSDALTAEQTPERWMEIVTLAVDTSIRRNVKPHGIPDNEQCHALAVKSAGAIPELAKLLGMRVPPPPPPTRPVRRPASRPAS
ncbi:MAG TPA: hypothetical protein VFN54_09890 [Acidimicrobiales bacterium]|nr:hypothetical protein [Acidimicrobiales bacterium]